MAKRNPQPRKTAKEASAKAPKKPRKPRKPKVTPFEGLIRLLVAEHRKFQTKNQ